MNDTMTTTVESTENTVDKREHGYITFVRVDDQEKIDRIQDFVSKEFPDYDVTVDVREVVFYNDKPVKSAGFKESLQKTVDFLVSEEMNIYYLNVTQFNENYGKETHYLLRNGKVCSAPVFPKTDVYDYK